MKWVIDTSVVVKWFYGGNEELLHQSDKLLADVTDWRIRVTAPDILVYELSNALLLGKKLSIVETQRHLREFFKLPIEIIPIDTSLIHETVAIAQQNGISIYDASFVALANLTDSLLITADPKHHGKIKDGTVVLLQDYPM